MQFLPCDADMLGIEDITLATAPVTSASYSGFNVSAGRLVSPSGNPVNSREEFHSVRGLETFNQIGNSIEPRLDLLMPYEDFFGFAHCLGQQGDGCLGPISTIAEALDEVPFDVIQHMAEFVGVWAVR